tara:strand:+ start:290 stop:757 length:468 start_codon:yes stop_codon:yes gene_type:complete
MKKLKPDSIIIKLYTSDYLRLEKDLHNRYKKLRIPQTEYFRLKNIHLKEIKNIIAKVDYPTSVTFEIFIKVLTLLCLIFLLVFIFMILNINKLNTVFLNSLYFMERISIFFSVISIFASSRRYLSLWNEFKFRTTRLIIFSLFSLSFRFASFILN